jgi:flagellar biogenesis protein FliO
VWRKAAARLETGGRRVQAILLTSSLVLVLAMVGSLAWLASRMPGERGAVPVESRDELL